MDAEHVGARIRAADHLIAAGLSCMAGLFFLWRVGVPSAWRDEAVSLEISRRPFAEILGFVRHTDAVHALYYLLLHGLFGPGVSLVQARCVAVLATAGSVAIVFYLATVLKSRSAGCIAGLLFASLPIVTRYAQEGRPYALAAFLASAAVLVLVLRRRGAHPVTEAVYVCLTVLSIFTSALTVLMFPVHLLITQAIGSGVANRIRGYIPTVIAGLLSLPFLIVAFSQRGQVAWLDKPSPIRLLSFFHSETESLLLLALLGVAAAFAAVMRRADRTLCLIALLWAGGMPCLLWVVSQAHPFFTGRYLIFTVPGVSLLAAVLIGDGMIRRGVAVLLLTGIAVTGSRMQMVYRDPVVGHAEDLRTPARAFKENARLGDDLAFLPGDLRIIALTHQKEFGVGHDVLLKASGRATATISGTEVGHETQVDRLKASADRLWIVTTSRGLDGGRGPSDDAKAAAIREAYRPAARCQGNGFDLWLFVRSGAPDVKFAPENACQAAS